MLPSFSCLKQPDIVLLLETGQTSESAVQPAKMVRITGRGTAHPVQSVLVVLLVAGVLLVGPRVQHPLCRLAASPQHCTCIESWSCALAWERRSSFGGNRQLCAAAARRICGGWRQCAGAASQHAGSVIMEVDSAPMIWSIDGQIIGVLPSSMMRSVGAGVLHHATSVLCPSASKARISLCSILNEPQGCDGAAPELYSCQKANSGSSNPASPAVKLVPRWSLPMMTSTCRGHTQIGNTII
jgi:hypothetical protein